MSTALGFAASLARRTGELLREYFRPFGMQIQLKADQSVVTQADLAADLLIAQAIREAFPEDGIISEELLPGLPVDHPNAVWIVDPLDGTTNFSLGLHIWGVAIARVVNGAPEIAAIYFPLLDELYTAQTGAGAYMNGERIQALPPDKNRPAAFFACCGNTHRHYTVNVPYKPRILGSAAYNFCAVARSAAVLCFEARPKIWDLAAPWVLVPEAGGVIEVYNDPSPFPLIPGQDYAARAFPSLAAATTQMVAKGREMILEK